MSKLRDTVICFDIETIERPYKDFTNRAEKIEEIYEKDMLVAESKAKEETKAKYRTIAEDKRTAAKESTPEGWKFSPAGAEIVCIAWREGLKTAHGIEWEDVLGIQAKEADAIKEFVSFLNLPSGPYSLVGFNISGFDYPVVARAILEHGMHLENKPGEYDLYDLMYAPLFRKSKGSQDYFYQQYGLGDVGDMDGSQVAQCYKDDCENNTTNVLKYCKHDVEKVSKLLDINYLTFDL